MRNGTHALQKPEPPTLFWLAFLLIPSLIPLVASIALSHNWEPTRGGAWFLYEVSRPLGCVGIIVATAIALRAAFQHTPSTLFRSEMTVAIASAATTLWFAVQIFKAAY